MIFITNIGDKYFIGILSLIILIFLLKKKEYLKSKMLIISLGLGVFISAILKITIQRERPLTMLINETGYSFPSRHATISLVFFGILIYIFKDEIKNKYTKILFISLSILLILLIGFSRLYLNVHWFTDVIGGYLIGLICVFFSIIIVKKSSYLRKNRLL